MHGGQTLMSKEERTLELFDKEVMLSGFKPKEGETVFLTVDPDKIDIETASQWGEYLSEMFPQNNIMVKIDGMTIESLPKEDLRMTFFVDGSCSGNGSALAKGGFGVVGLKYDNPIYFFASGSQETTNNREELKAILHVFTKFGLDIKNQRVLSPEEYPIVYSDSRYAVNTLTEWMFNWAKNDWTKSDGKTPENLDLIKTYYELWQQGWRIDLRKVQGHAGVYWNEVADEMAKRANAQQKNIELNMILEGDLYGEYNSNSDSE